MEQTIKISYVSNLPLQGDSPKIEFKDSGDYYFEFIDNNTGKPVFTGLTKGNETVTGLRQWFTNWKTLIKDKKGNVILEDNYNAKGKTVFIKIDGHALGDNLAWMPYIEEFRKKHQCNVVCSTFWNDLFIDVYPNILFVKPNTQIYNIYAQYYIGANGENNLAYCPIITKNKPLQMIASVTLGLENKEITPLIKRPENLKNKFDSKYVCISEFASHEMKMWKEKGGWQTIVDFLNSQGYKVIVISKEKTNLKNVIDKSGDYHINDRINDLYYCEFFMGVSSGLSWLAWGLNRYVVMISDFTPHYHEFNSNITRIGKNTAEKIGYNYPNPTSKKEVINKLKELID